MRAVPRLRVQDCVATGSWFTLLDFVLCRTLEDVNQQRANRCNAGRGAIMPKVLGIKNHKSSTQGKDGKTVFRFLSLLRLILFCLEYWGLNLGLHLW